MFDYLTIIVPVIIALAIYFVRLESRLSKICVDISWIKRSMQSCQPTSEKVSQ